MRKPACAGIAVALFCAFCAGMLSTRGAQGQAAGTDASQTAPGGSSAANTAEPSTKPAKVWTNDDLNGLNGRGAAPSSAVRKPKPAPKPAAATKNPAANPYQSEIAKLQAQLPPIDTQIANLQAALSGQPVNSPRKYVSVRPDDWQAQLVDLQKKKSDILSQIDALEDQARHAGVATNVLP